jgi:hypothetical protein
MENGSYRHGYTLNTDKFIGDGFLYFKTKFRRDF